MRAYSLKVFAGLTILCIVVGVLLVEFAYLGLDALYPYASTSSGGSPRDTGKGFSIPSGELSLAAFTVPPSDVELTLSLVNHYRRPNYDLTVWVADVENRHRYELPKGFELVSGNLSWYGSAETAEMNLEATIRAVKDGEWELAGWALWYSPGSSQATGSGILEIVVSNGRVTDIRRVKQEFSEPVAGGQMMTQVLNISADLEIDHDLILDNNNVTIFRSMRVLIHGNVKLFENATLILDNAELYVLGGDVVLVGTSKFIALRSIVDPNAIRAGDDSNLFISNTRLLCSFMLDGSAQLNLSNSNAGSSNLYGYSKAAIVNSTLWLGAEDFSTVYIYNCNLTALEVTETSNVEIFDSTIGEIYLLDNPSLSMFSSKVTYLNWRYYRGAPLWNGSVYFHWRMTVKVVDYMGSPIASAEVKITRVDGDATQQIFNGTTDSEGIVETYLLQKTVSGGKILMGGNETIAREEEVMNDYNIEAIYSGNSASTTVLINNDISIQLEV